MVLNCDSHQSLSENRGSQSESNEDPIRAYQKREDLSKPYRSLGEELRFSIYYCKADPPLKKKIGGGFTIVDVTLNRSHNINISIQCFHSSIDRKQGLGEQFSNSRSGNPSRPPVWESQTWGHHRTYPCWQKLAGAPNHHWKVHHIHAYSWLVNVPSSAWLPTFKAWTWDSYLTYDIYKQNLSKNLSTYVSVNICT